MNIAMVSPYSWDYPGGVNRHVEQLSKKLRGRGHEVSIIAPDGFEDGNIFSAGRSIAVASNKSVAHLSFGPRTASRIRSILRSLRPDILHLHEPLIPGSSMLALALSTSANIATFHAAREVGSMGYRLARPILNPLAGRLHFRAAVSPAALELVSRYFPGIYHILPNGVDTDVFKPDGPGMPGLDESAFYLIFVGREEPRKGLNVLLDAMPLVRRRFPEVRLMVVGVEGGTRKEEGVEWMGRLSDELVPCSYRSARIMVSPALGWESFGIVLIEAMACGLPVMASNIPGYRAVLEDGVQGVLTPPGDVRALSEALIGLIGEDERRMKMSESALERSKRYSWRRLVGDVEGAYAEALQRSKEVV